MFVVVQFIQSVIEVLKALDVDQSHIHYIVTLKKIKHFRII